MTLQSEQTRAPLTPQEFIGRLRERTPRLWVTKVLIGLNVAVYLGMCFTGASPMSPSIRDLLRWGADAGALSLQGGEAWRLFTSMFVHIGIIHIGMNMAVLWSIGPFIERLAGNLRCLILYLLCGLTGSVLSSLIHPTIVSAGASGAIFGLYGVLLGYLLRHRHTVPPSILKSLQRSGGAFVLYNLLFSVAIPGIDLSAHLGGLIAGFLLGLAAVP